MFYYCSYSNGRRYVRAYDDTKHGVPRIVSDTTTFLYHNSVMVSRVFPSERAALAWWGEWSEKPVIMPDGREVVPAWEFGHDTTGNIFIPWPCVRGEVWPGDK